MPEAFVVLGIFTVAVTAWLMALIRSRDPALRNPVEDTRRLQQHAAWLEQRLSLARREKWDADMIAALAEELNATSRQLGQTAARAEVR